MKKDIHPAYRPTVFEDISSGARFLIYSTLSSKEKIQWKDGKIYSLVKLEISSASHPFYTGKNIYKSKAGRVERFNKKYNRK